MKRGTTPFHVDRRGCHLTLDAVPAWVYQQCGEAHFEEKEVDAIQDLVLVGKSRSDWQETEYVLRQFGIEKGRALRSYRKFMEEGKGIGRRPDLVGGGLIRSHGGWSRVLSLRERGENPEHDSRILGSGDFVERVMREADETLARQIKQRRGKGSIDAVIRRMCKEEGVREQELKTGGQRRRISGVRARIACYLSREMGISMAEIARNLGVGTSAVAMAIKKEESSRNL